MRDIAAVVRVASSDRGRRMEIGVSNDIDSGGGARVTAGSNGARVAAGSDGVKVTAGSAVIRDVVETEVIVVG